MSIEKVTRWVGVSQRMKKNLQNRVHIRQWPKQERKIISFYTFLNYKMRSPRYRISIQKASVLINLFINQGKKLFLRFSMIFNNRTNNVRDNDRGKSVNCNLFGAKYFETKFMDSLNKGALLEMCKSKNVNESKLQVIQPQTNSKITEKRTMELTVNLAYSKAVQKQGSEITQKKKTIQTRICRVRGLNNIGNTCYMNSILQCLLNLSKFNSEFRAQIKLFKTNKLQVSLEYGSMIDQFLENYSSSSFVPSRLKTAIGRKKCRFLGNAQQDSQQFLTAFLELVNEEMSRVKQKPKYVELQNNPKERSIKSLSQEWWNYYKLRDDSIICDNFEGQLISIVTCKRCKNQSVTFDNIWGLPLSLPKITYSVSDLIANNWSIENQIEDYYCSVCKRQRDCTKKLEFFRLPEILVIQLKRFQYGKWRKEKIKTPIKLTDNLDLSEFLNKNSEIQNSKYKLVGMVHHFGEVDYGHYTASAYKQNEKRWYLLNDSSTSQKTPETYNNTVYLLFYTKI